MDVAKGLITMSADAQQALAVKSTPVEMRTQEQKALAYARLVLPWQQLAFVSPRIAGRLTKVFVQSGEHVEAGTILAEIGSPELETLQQELLAALNSQKLAAQNEERTKKLAREQIIPGRDWLEAQVKLRDAENAIQIARSKLRAVGFTDDQIEQMPSSETLLTLPIKSPLAGIVNHTDLSIGKTVAANEHLFEVSDLSRIWIRLEVLEHDVNRVEKGQTVELELRAYPREIHKAAVEVPCVALDPVTHLGTAWASLENSATGEPRFLPGMYGQAQITISSPEKLLTVPIAALQGVGAERYVLVETAATGKAMEYRKQGVSVVAETATHAQLKSSGLFPGDRVVTTGSHILSSYFILGVLKLSPDAIRNIGMRLEPALPQVVEQTVEFDGVLDLPPEQRALISAQVNGVLSKVLVTPGQQVNAGDVLAEVTSLGLQDLQLELLQGQLDAALWENALARIKDLRGTQGIAQKRLDEMENLRQAAVNQRDGAKRKLEALGISPKQLTQIMEQKELLTALPIRATISGILVSFDKVLGEAVQADAAIFELQNLSRFYVKGAVAERIGGAIRNGMSVRVRLAADPLTVYTGKIVRSNRTYGQDSRTLLVWIELNQLPTIGLRQNMLARISATVDSPPPTLAVPRGALVREGARSFVFVQGANGGLERRAVTTGRYDDQRIEIRSGIQPQERIVVHGTAELQTTYSLIR
ncbi:MAG: efflux RND transporter periplasmic adaptor subunit [Pirellulales bacterium]|nr:efflux RND transporter periplasmic adaptor subunit [Pirellulales bacterium]